MCQRFLQSFNSEYRYTIKTGQDFLDIQNLLYALPSDVPELVNPRHCSDLVNLESLHTYIISCKLEKIPIFELRVPGVQFGLSCLRFVLSKACPV